MIDGYTIFCISMQTGCGKIIAWNYFYYFES